MTTIRDRVVGFCRAPANQLVAHPDNWRLHPDSQRRALQSLLDDIGFAGAVLARQLPDGRLQVIDGHLRAAAAGEAQVPVLVVDLDDAEARRALLTHDALGSLAEIDGTALGQLLATCPSTPESLAQWLAEASDLPEATAAEATLPRGDEMPIPAVLQVTVECQSEAQQREVYERLTSEGWKCRVLTL